MAQRLHENLSNWKIITQVAYQNVKAVDFEHFENIKREFVNIYKEFFPDGEPQNFAEWVFRAFDTKNQDIFIKSLILIFVLSEFFENISQGSINFDQFIRAVAIIGHGTIGESPIMSSVIPLKKSKFVQAV